MYELKKSQYSIGVPTSVYFGMKLGLLFVLAAVLAAALLAHSPSVLPNKDLLRDLIFWLCAAVVVALAHQFGAVIMFSVIIYGLFHQPTFIDDHEEIFGRLVRHFKELNARDSSRTWVIAPNIMWLSITLKKPLID